MLSEDLIKGAGAIAAHLGAHVTPRSVYHMADKGLIPVIRKGRSLYARKSDLDQAFASEAA